MENKEKIELLRMAVLEDAQKEADSIEKETESIIRETTETEKKRLEDEIAEIKALNDIELRKKDEQDLILKENKYKRELLLLRDKFLSEIFTAVKSKILELKKTNMYSEYIALTYRTVKNVIGNADLIYCMPGEEDIVIKIFPDIRVKTDRNIKIGGVVFKHDNLVSDCTFDKRIADEYDTFVDSGKLRF